MSERVPTMKSLNLITIIAFGMAVAPLDTVAGQTPSCSVKDPNTGADCVSSRYTSRSPNSTGYTYRYTFTNTCDRSFDLIMDTGTGQIGQKTVWIGRADSNGPKIKEWLCIQGYNGMGDCQSISWSYDC